MTNKSKNQAVVTACQTQLGKEIAFTPIQYGSQWTVGVCQRGKSGYSRLSGLFFGEQSEMSDTASELNELAGVDQDSMIQTITSSMFTPWQTQHQGAAQH